VNLASLFRRHRRRRLLDRIETFATVLEPGAAFSGELHAREDCLVRGSGQGRAEVDGSLVVAEGGDWQGDICAANIVVSGAVVGNLRAHQRIVLTASARVRGDVIAPVVAIAHGARLEGEVSMPQARVTHFGERRQVRAAG
jgi:cytoskeletal protein CcmA (bactofilin family)